MLIGKDIGIDLGTATVLIYVKGKGIVLREPSVVAMDKNSGRLLKVGSEAEKMLGRTPGNIVAIKPLREGVISDYDMTERMLKEMLSKVTTFSLIKPRLVICVPSGITEVEERAVIDAGIQAGARKVYLIEEPVAAAIGQNRHYKARRPYGRRYRRRNHRCRRNIARRRRGLAVNQNRR